MRTLLATLLLLAAASIAAAQTSFSDLYGPSTLPLDPRNPMHATVLEQLLIIAPPPPGPSLEVTPGHIIVGCVQVPLGDGNFTFQTWPGGIIPYEFDGNMNQSMRDAATAAMNSINIAHAVVFTPRQNFHLSWIYFRDSSGNSAPVGFGEGQRIVNILNWDSPMILIHELYHVLGVFHEQSRPDRDTYVIINTANISQTACNGPCNFNFNITNSQTYGYYDFESVMHYSRNAFSSNGMDTITVRPPWNATWQTGIGQRNRLSEMDLITGWILYPPVNIKWLDASRPPGVGTFGSPFNNWSQAHAATPENGRIIINPGNYSAVGTYTRPMTLHAPAGTAVLGN